MSPDPIEVDLAVADWRRRVRDLYAEIRATDDPRQGHQRWRAGRDALFGDHPASPVPAAERSAFTGLPVADYDPAWRFELPVHAAAPERMLASTGTDGEVPFDRIGRLDVPGVGSLDVWSLRSYAGGIFVPVRDGLAGRPGGTYGGGRYLLDTVKGADLGPGRQDRTLVIDFNFAYNPSCAYDPAWACPLPRAGNTVEPSIEVGELVA